MGVVITLVVAASKNNAIGKDNQLPWRLPNDMKYFKNVTWGMPVLMGRKTFESLGTALPGRKNMVLTRQSKWKAKDVVVVKDFDDAIFLTREMDVKELMVIGGGEIFKAVFEKADRIHITRVDGEFEADAFFPEIDHNLWLETASEKHLPDDKNNLSFTFSTLERK